MYEKPCQNCQHYEIFMRHLELRNFDSCRSAIKNLEVFNRTRPEKITKQMEEIKEILQNIKNVKEVMASIKTALEMTSRLDYTYYKRKSPINHWSRDQPKAMNDFEGFIKPYNIKIMDQIKKMESYLSAYSKLESVPISQENSYKSIGAEQPLSKFVAILRQEKKDNIDQDKISIQYESALKYIYNFSANKDKLNLISDKSKQLLEEYSTKLKDYQQKQRDHEVQMDRKTKELTNNRKRVQQLEQKSILREKKMKEKIIQINASIIDIPLTKEKYQWVDQMMNLDDMIEAAIKNAFKVVNECFKLKQKLKQSQQKIKVEPQPEFMIGDLEESSIGIDSGILESFMEGYDPRQIQILEDQIKNLTNDNKMMTNQMHHLSKEISQQKHIIQHLDARLKDVYKQNRQLNREIQQQMITIQRQNKLLMQSFELETKQSELSLTHSINDIQYQVRSQFKKKDDEKENRKLIEKLLHDNKVLEQKIQDMEREIKYKESQHEKQIRKMKEYTQIIIDENTDLSDQLDECKKQQKGRFNELKEIKLRWSSVEDEYNEEINTIKDMLRKQTKKNQELTVKLKQSQKTLKKLPEISFSSEKK